MFETTRRFSILEKPIRLSAEKLQLPKAEPNRTTAVPS